MKIDPRILFPLLLTGIHSPASEGLSLSNAWDIALADSPSYQATRQRLEQAEARWRQSRSTYQPRITLQAGGTHLEYSDTDRLRIPGAPDSADQFNAGLQAEWLLFDGGTRKGSAAAARAEADAGLEQVNQARQDLMRAVAGTFFTAQLSRENIRIAKADAAFNARQLAESELRHAAGQTSHADTLNFAIRMNSASTTVVLAENDYNAALASLAALLGQEISLDLPEPVALETPSSVTPAPGFPSAWSVAATNLPGLIALRHGVRQAEAGAGAVRGTYLPDLALFGGVEASREEDPNFASGDVGQTVGISVSVDLWDGRQRRAQLREAKARISEARAILAQAELDAQSALRSALGTYDASRERMRLSDKTLTMSRENRDLIEKAYRAGSESLLRLNEAQRDYNTAEARAVLARIQFENARIALDAAMGVLGTNGP